MDMADMKPFGVISWQLYPACYGWKYSSTPSSQHWIHREAYIYVYSILVYANCWLAHTCLCAVTITNVSRHLCEEVTSFEVGWIS